MMRKCLMTNKVANYIKPYDLAEKDYEQQYWKKVFQQIIEDDIK